MTRRIVDRERGRRVAAFSFGVGLPMTCGSKVVETGVVVR